MVNNLNKRVLILGGYGTFGARIAQLLSNEPGIRLIIAGRDKFKAEVFASKLDCPAEGLRLERDAVNLAAQLKLLNLDLLIHCAGPFQNRDYRVAQACIDARVPYIDIADARRFVCDFQRLNGAAEAAGVAMVSGASSLPGLSSAVLQEIGRELPQVEAVEMEIAPAHRIARGLATVRAGFEALGQGFPMLQNGRWHETFTGADLRRASLAHPVGERWLCNFDVPDLELCPRALPNVKSVRFGTGVQPRLLQLGLALCAQLARLQIPATKPWIARLGHRLAARWPGGSPHGGMRVRAEGQDAQSERSCWQWQILGLNGDGPWIPAAPAAALARKMLRTPFEPGARPCWQLLQLHEILAELNAYSIVTSIEQLAPAASAEAARRVSGSAS